MRIRLTIGLLFLIAAPLLSQSAPVEGSVVPTATQLADDGHTDEALRLLEARLAAEPGDDAARITYASILAQDARFTDARRALGVILTKNPHDPEATAALVRIEIATGHPSLGEHMAGVALETSPDNADLLVARARALRALNRKPEARVLVDRALAHDPENDDGLRLRRILEQELGSSEVMGAVNIDHWSDGRDTWRESLLSVRRNTTFGPAIARFSRAAQAGAHDDNFELEALPRVRSTYAFLGFGHSSEGLLYPKTRFAAELFQGVQGFEGSIGLRRLNFNGPINIYTASLGRYHRDWFFSLRGYHTAGVQGSSAVQFMARRYFADGTQYIGLRAGKGASRDDIRSSADLASLETHDIAGEGLFVVHNNVLVTVRAALGQDHSILRHSAHRVSLTAGLGYRF